MGMGIGNALGGIGLGISRGAKDIRDWEDEKFKKTQRARILKEQADADELSAGLKSVPPEGTVEVADESGGHAVTRTGEQVARDRAGVYQRHGKDEAATALLNRAEALKNQYANEGAMKEVRRLRDLRAKNPNAFVSESVGYYNDGINDGKQLIPFTTKDGKTMFTHVDQTTGQTLGTIPASEQLMDAMFRTRIRMAMANSNDPNVFFHTLNSEMEEAKLGLQSKQHAETLAEQRRFHDMQDKRWGEMSANDRIRAQAEAARAGRETAALKKFEALEGLAGRAEGMRMGLTRAQQLGPEGAQAAAIYKEQMDGINQRLLTLGVKPQSTEDRGPGVRMKAYIDLLNSGHTPAQARRIVDTTYGAGEDTQAVVDALKKAFPGAGETAPGKTAAPPALLPPGTYAESPTSMFDEMYADAKRGGVAGLSYLRDKLATGDLKKGQVERARKLIEGK